MTHRVNPCSYLPRRLQIIVTILLFCVISIISVGGHPRSREYIPYSQELHEGARHALDAVTDRLPTFAAPSHRAPAQQLNSSSGDASWFADFKWHNPFSDTVTFDEDRSVLPPEKTRPSIYTYFEAREKGRDEKVLAAELELVNIWRRAWWAKGFKPMVLGRGDAMKNPLYQQAASLKLGSEVEDEMMRWLAWSTMGTGILCNWLAVPMSAYDEALLNFLRRGDFPQLTRFGDLGHGIFVGTKPMVEKVVKTVIESKHIREISNFVDAIPSEMLRIDKKAESIAFYSGDVIASKYAPIKDKFSNNTILPEGLSDLGHLINSHLHTIWQNQFPMGVHVLKPIPQRSTHMIEPAIDIARNLTQCSWSPMPSSCPPNRPNCKTCVASSPLRLHTPPVYRNQSDIFVIATVPHPYTLNCLFHQREDLNYKFVRRQTARDKWIVAATAELLGTGISAYRRLSTLKDAVASDLGQARTLWLTAETTLNAKDNSDSAELDWLFGFQLPGQHVIKAHPMSGPELRPPPPKPDFGEGPVLSEAELAAEARRLELSQIFLKSPSRAEREANMRMKNFVEAWNLADTEAWKFVRAFNARRSTERRKWEDEEKAFLGQSLWNRLISHLSL